MTNKIKCNMILLNMFFCLCTSTSSSQAMYSEEEEAKRVASMRQAIVQDTESRYPNNQNAGAKAGQYFDQQMGQTPSVNKAINITSKEVDAAVQKKQ